MPLRPRPAAAAAAALLALVAAPAMANDGAHGLWKTQTNENGAYLHVRLGPCADDAAATCGVIDAAFNGTGADIVGKPMIFDMAPDGPNKWDSGRIWAPDDDKTYRANMELKGADLLRVEGCVLVFCRGQDWTRVK